MLHITIHPASGSNQMSQFGALISEIKSIITPLDSSLFPHQFRERWTWSQETCVLELAHVTPTLGHLVTPAAPISQGG